MVHPDTERVAQLVVTAFRDVLGARVTGVVVHGSAVTGHIPGFSDFDCVVCMHGTITRDDSIELQRRLGDADISPFSYLQLSRLLDPDASERHTGLIPDAYYVADGELPQGWAFHTEDELRERGRDELRALAKRAAGRYEDWSVEGPRRGNRLRLFMTEVKPSTRVLLVELGEPVFATWTRDYYQLVERLLDLDPERGAILQRIVTALPYAPADEPAVGADVLHYLDAVSLWWEQHPSNGPSLRWSVG
jgi:hypothetical protein